MFQFLIVKNGCTEFAEALEKEITKKNKESLFAFFDDLKEMDEYIMASPEDRVRVPILLTEGADVGYEIDVLNPRTATTITFYTCENPEEKIGQLIAYKRAADRIANLIEIDLSLPVPSFFHFDTEKQMVGIPTVTGEGDQKEYHLVWMTFMQAAVALLRFSDDAKGVLANIMYNVFASYDGELCLDRKNGGRTKCEESTT